MAGLPATTTMAGLPATTSMAGEVEWWRRLDF
jgi:hypothetical protein